MCFLQHINISLLIASINNALSIDVLVTVNTSIRHQDNKASLCMHNFSRFYKKNKSPKTNTMILFYCFYFWLIGIFYIYYADCKRVLYFCAFQNCFMNFIIILYLPRKEFVTYQRVCNKSNTMGVTCGVRTLEST
jgi:hypothetical protein